MGNITNNNTCWTQQCDTRASPTGSQSEWRLPKQNRLAKLSTEYQYVVSQPQPLLGFLAKLRHCVMRTTNSKNVNSYAPVEWIEGQTGSSVP